MTMSLVQFVLCTTWGVWLGWKLCGARSADAASDKWWDGYREGVRDGADIERGY